MRTASSPSWRTNVFVARDRPRSLAHWTRYAFVDRTLEVSLLAASKVSARSTFAIVTLAKPPGPDAKARKAVADKRRAATVAAAATRAPLTAEAVDAPWPPQKK
jgi:hypothetical protein